MTKSRAAELPQKTFGRLTVVGREGLIGRHAAWQCRCSCGVLTVVKGTRLRSGNVVSCGCEYRERPNYRGRTHGMTQTPTYKTWCAMRRRCHDQAATNFDRYGARGVTVCERWEAFENFLADMGERPVGMSLDRIDNARGYEPRNCRWATPTQQARNTRNNRMLSHAGETLCMADWAERTGLPYSVIASRVEHGWSDGRALTTPHDTTRIQKRYRHA